MKHARATGSDWCGQVNAWGAAAVAGRFGLELVAVGADTSFACPVCGKGQRHSKSTDKRRAAKVTPDRGGWWCEPCGAKGDAVALAAVAVTGDLKPPLDGWRLVRQECAALGLCEADPRDPRGPGGQVRYVPPARPVVTVAQPARLPAAEVAALWGACSRLDAVPGWELEASAGGWCGEVRTFLATGRGLDVGALAALDVARVLPPPARVSSWPTWWPSSWCRSWRLVVPLYDARGELAALQARAIDGSEAPKTRNPMGAGVTSGTFFANREGLELLRGAYSGPSGVFVEGLTDFLAATALLSALEPQKRPAVLAVIAGSAKAAGQIVTTRRFVVMTDNDETGEKYFRELEAATGLSGIRKKLARIDGKKADVNDWARRDAQGLLKALTTGGAHVE